jgi:hypothetical protein
MTMVAAAGAVAAQRHKRIVAADRLWSAYAQARGVRHRPGREGWAHTEMPRIDASVGNVAVALELIDDIWDPSAFVGVAMARPAVAIAGHVEARREGVLSRIAEMFGARDIALGDEPFDRAFVVKATDETAARTLLPTSVTSELLELEATFFAYDDGSENSSGAVVLAYLPFRTSEFAWIDRALAFVARVAQIRAESGAPYR